MIWLSVLRNHMMKRNLIHIHSQKIIFGLSAVLDLISYAMHGFDKDIEADAHFPSED